MSDLAGVQGTVPMDEYEALMQFLYMAPIGLAELKIDGEVVMVNPLCAQLLMPLSPDGGLDNLFDALRAVAPDLALRVADFAPAQGKVCDALHLQIDSGLPGQRDPQVLSLSLIKLDGQRLMAVLDDVSVSFKRDRELRQSQAWIQTIVTGISDYALLSLDHAGQVLRWNQGVRNVTGFDAESTVGQSYAVFYADADRLAHRVPERLTEADLGGWSLEECWLQRANGERYWGSCLIAPLHDHQDEAPAPDQPRAYSLIIRDISDRRESHEALRRSALCDHLTGLVNRRAFFDAAAVEVERCARTGQPLSAVVFDADHFKQVNDSHGHAAGDSVLRHLAAGLCATFRATDIVARFGGEEFVVLLPGVAVDDAARVAQRLCERVAGKPVLIDDLSIRYTVSGGVAAMGPDVEGLDALLKRADAAMYAAKAQGRNRVVRWSDDLAGGPVADRVRA